MANEIKFKITIEDGGSQNTVREVTGSVENLDKAIAEVVRDSGALSDSMGGLNSSVINFSQIAQGIDSVSGMFSKLQGTVDTLSQYYAAQETVEVKLATAMRNTMDATDAEIQSIKDLASAQQQLGVIGDEVQLAGAQEMATYLGEAESLRTLLPVMNDMIAQQYGLNASQESAAQIASMMGKVMEGQTGALSRYGYSFTEAQEQILKFGTESERAATLAEVISQSVGGMNAELAKTDSGKQQQLANAIGDVKEQLGAIAVQISPFVTMATGALSAAGEVAKCYNALKALNEVQAISAIRSKLAAVHTNMLAAAQRMLSAAGVTATASTTALTVAVTALYAALTLGISVIITAIASAVAYLNSEVDDFTDKVDQAKGSTDSFNTSVTQTRAQLDMEIAALKKMKDGTAEAKQKVDELNGAYGKAFGYHKTATEWYNTLVAKSQAYCQQLGYEAQAKVIASQKAAKELEFYANGQDMNNYLAKGGTSTNDSAYRAMTQKSAALLKDIQSLGHQFDTCIEKAGEAAKQMDAAVVATTTTTSTKQTKQTTSAKVEETFEAGTLGEIEQQLQKLQQKRRHATAENIAGINDEIERLQALRQEMESATNLDMGVTGTKIDWAAMPVDQIKNYDQLGKVLDALDAKMQKASVGDQAAIQRQISAVNRLKSEWDAANKAIDDEINPVIKPEVDMTEAVRGMKGVQQAWGGIKGIGNGIDSITNAIEGNGSAWNKITGIIDGALTIYNGIASAMEIITILSNAHTAAKTAEAAAEVTEAGTSSAANATAIAESATVTTALGIEAGAWSAVAAAKTFAAHAAIPFVGTAIAAGFVTQQQIMISMASIPKFAKGTIATRPTFGLFGEYPGASSNPEVVATVNNLREAIGIDTNGNNGSPYDVGFYMRVSGHNLEAVGQKTRKKRSRTLNR